MDVTEKSQRECGEDFPATRMGDRSLHDAFGDIFSGQWL